MKNFNFFISYFALVIFTTSACINEPLIINEVVEIDFRERTTIPLANLNIEFAEILEESRCPIGANCIQAGRARVQLKIAPILPSQVDTLSSIIEIPGLSEEVGLDTVDNFIITLMELTPYPDVQNPASFENDKTVKLKIESL